MRKAGAPAGNLNAAKRREFYRAMMLEASPNDWERLRRIARKVLTLAERGEDWACTLVRDTLDGRPRQQLEVSGEDGAPLTVQIVRFGDLQSGGGDDPPA